LELAGLSFSAGGEGIVFVPASQPSLADSGVPNTVSVAWLKSFAMDAGQRLLLGYLQSNSPPSVLGVSANAVSGDSIAVEATSLSRKQ
jgi:hypothetical protein